MLFVQALGYITRLARCEKTETTKQQTQYMPILELPAAAANQHVHISGRLNTAQAFRSDRDDHFCAPTWTLAITSSLACVPYPEKDPPMCLRTNPVEDSHKKATAAAVKQPAYM